MERVIFDLLCSQPIGDVKYHGGGEYTKTVFSYFTKHYGTNTHIEACFNQHVFIDDWLMEIINDYHVKVVHVNNVDEINTYLQSLDASDSIRFFAGMVYAYKNVSFPPNVFSIGTCHGLRAIEKPIDRYQKYYYRYSDHKLVDNLKELVKRHMPHYSMKRYKYIYGSSIEKFKVVVTDSNHSAYSIKVNFPDIAFKKRIIPLYPMTQLLKVDENNNKLEQEKYIMIISANRWVKNSYRAVQSIDLLYSAKLIDGLSTKVYGNLPEKLRKKVVNKDKFCFYDYVSSDELETAYARCEVLFYPTLNEGFGNVPMEAMKYGKTCVVSAVCSLPEVYGNTVYYCNPYDIMEMANRILQAIDCKKDVSLMRQRIAEISDRQSKDMEYLCKLIINEENAK